MGRLGDDSSAVLDVVRRIATTDDPNGFGAVALAELATLVPFDQGVFNQVDPSKRDAFFVVHPPDAPSPAWTFDTYDRYLPRNPIFQHSNRHADGSARRLSDFVGEDELRSLPLYKDILEPLAMRYQVAFSLGYRRPLIVAFSLNRATHDFTDGEVATLDLVRPHLSRIYRRLREQTESARPKRADAANELQHAFGLTRRESQILSALATGATTDAIAARLGISARTVDKHLEHIYRKLDVSNRFGALAAVTTLLDRRS